ncbi:uncharacterized protein LOC129589716 [Paramacrobiotus metropolitanus]|uniref:uncharacterized protein LOC129589716 n=1 Tax=Paramacrobiotus metropolitanus TaxID=2943436 RepID=UPI002445DDAF|nr:uncharacterized protein LOC129589716 [Paramacrobiotus metropolitanus]
MENFLSARIGRDPLITGVYERFAVDILDENVTYRGYVCAVDDDHCMVRIGSMQELRRVAMDKLHLMDYRECKRIHPHTVPEEIDVLVSVDDNQPESWQPASIIGGKLIQTFSLVHAEVSLPGNAPRQFCVLDSSGAAFKRIRRRGYLGNRVTPQSFVNQQIPVSKFTSYCTHFADTLQKVREMPRFHSRFMQETYGIMFLGATDDHIDLLVEEKYNQNDGVILLVEGKPSYKLPDHIMYERIANAVDRFMIDFMRATDKIANTVLKELVALIDTDQDLNKSHEFHFDDVLMELSTEVFSFMDVYDQHQLRRTSKFFHQRLFCKALRRCVMLPNQHKHSIESLRVGPSGSGYRDLAYVIGSTISQDARILYFIDDWEECLFTLVKVLKVMDVQLDWLVIANNSRLLLNEFLRFPKPFPMVYTYDFVTMYGNYLHANQTDIYKDYACICQHLALKNCCFSSKLSICFREVLWLDDELLHRVRGPGRWNLRCCRDPFFIAIPRWLHSFSESAAQIYEASFRSALEDHCPMLTERAMDNLFHWLNSLTSEACEPKGCIWPFITLSYELWNEKPPKHLDDIVADISRKYSPKSCILQTMALLLPCISGSFCCFAYVVDGEALQGPR